jgi:hypothetical protein
VGFVLCVNGIRQQQLVLERDLAAPKPPGFGGLEGAFRAGTRLGPPAGVLTVPSVGYGGFNVGEQGANLRRDGPSAQWAGGGGNCMLAAWNTIDVH